MFAAVRVGNYCASIAWGEEGGDLLLDAYHLHLIAVEQRPFRNVDLVHWQDEIGLSNQEAADFLRVALSSWHAYKAGTSAVPAAVAMVCRAAKRDPLLLNAHFRPRPKAGRPRRGEAP